MQASADSITRRLRDHGYPSALVFTGFEVDKPKRSASVSLEVVPGRRRCNRPDPGGRSGTGGFLAGAQTAGGPARQAVLAGGAVSEPAKSLRVGSVPVCLGEHRLGGLSAGHRFGAAAGAGQRRQAAPDPGRPGICHQRLLPRLAGLDLARFSGRRPDSGSHQPGLQGGSGRAAGLGSGRQHLRRVSRTTPSGRPS